MTQTEKSIITATQKQEISGNYNNNEKTENKISKKQKVQSIVLAK